MKHYDTIIIGAGPAGLIAAIECYEPSKKICILEKMDKAGKKLIISGKGRCNITNNAELNDFLSHFGKNKRFLRYAFSNFFNKDLLEYFLKLGIKFKLERGGRYFPESDNSEEIVNVLLKKIKNLNIPIFTNHSISRISKKNNIFEILLENKRNTFSSNKLLIATGGKSYPNTGSNGDGYKFAESFGHNVTEIIPALVPLKTAGNIAKQLSELSLKNITVSLWSEKNGVKKKIIEKFGEMEFRSYGVTGPVILTISKDAVLLLKNNYKVFITLDLKPALDHKKIDSRILREIKNNPNKNILYLLSKLLPKLMIPMFMKILNISEIKKLNQINGDERKKLRLLLKEFELEIIDYLSYNNAIITSGGVSIKEVDQTSMESKLVKGLFFAGEIMDIDADTGGFNLQAAFSTGFLAGKNMKIR